jgi:thiol-disulfide isomerase/thioredoxin
MKFPEVNGIRLFGVTGPTELETADTFFAAGPASQAVQTFHHCSLRERSGRVRCPKRILINALILILLLSIPGIFSTGFPGVADAAELFEVNAENLAAVQMQVPEAKAERDYLGLSGTGTFTPAQIKANIIIIELFNMYCPVCQKEAPVVNELYRQIEMDKDLKGKVKIIGIGMSNTPLEVNVFRKNFRVEFPLFPDDTFRLRKISTQQLKTPTFIVANAGAGEAFKVLNVHVGRIKEPGEFLAILKRFQGEK